MLKTESLDVGREKEEIERRALRIMRRGLRWDRRGGCRERCIENNIKNELR